MSSSPCEDLITKLKTKGATILQDKQEGSDDLLGRIVRVQKEQCQMKISYLNLGDKQIIVQKTCKCQDQNCWKNIPEHCLSNFLM